jgi:hypothetical protein
MSDDNGRRIHRGDPIIEKILAIKEQCAANGLRYPHRAVDDLYKERFVRWGGVTYDANDYTLLELSPEGRSRPIILPDHFVIDGSERLPGEPQHQYAQYLAYRDLGPERSFTLAAKTGRATPSRVNQVSSRFRWKERAAIWDAKIEGEMRATAERLIQNRMEEEVKRRDNYLDNEWQVVEKGFHVINEMLKYPVVEQESVKTSADGKTIVTVWKPGKWTYSAMAQLIETLSKVGRLHTGLSTSNTSQKIDAQITDTRDVNEANMSGDDLAMHQYASRKAEESYFQACEEWKANRQQPIKAVVAA